ncbi:MAG TPA: GNAT family N-acetyltransferase [Gemmatimonadales bacterium]|nr:GNAT family N-acetyltransferase [Gemmatimonadales bacterium]
MLTEMVVTYLQMREPGQLRGVNVAPAGISLTMVPGADAGRVAGECYRTIGEPWHWVDRRHLDDAAWQELIEQEQGEVWIATDAEGLAGYFHLARKDADIEIRYFGLMERCHGRGIGKWLLTRAVERAWSRSPRRVVLNTCTLDGPAALPNYLRRGFEVVREEVHQREIP